MAKIEFKKSLFKDSFILDPEDDLQVKTAEQCFNLVGMLVVAIDLDYNITMANKSALNLLGISSEKKVIGKNWIEFIAKTNDAEKIKNIYSNLIAKKKLLNEKIIYKINSINKQVNYVDTRHIPINDKNSNIIGILLTGEDITEQIKYQIFLKQNINLYNTLGDNLPGIDMYMFNHDLEFILAEGKELRKQGFKKSNFIGKTVYDIKNKQLQNIFIPLCESVLDGSEIATEFAIKDLFYNIWVIPIKDDNKKIIAGLIILQNITKEKHDSELLQKAKKKAEQANASKTQFLANVAHEIRTPLNAILGFSEQLLKTQLDNKQLNFTNIIENSAEHLLKLVNDLLVISKIEAGELALNKTVFHVKSFVENIFKSLNIRAKEKTINLRYNIDPSLDQYLKGDEFRLKQILINILNNAIKFTESGYVELNIYKVQESQRTIKIRFDIIDTGFGIPEEKIASVFDQYEQVDPDITHKFGGTGLGLTICKKLVDILKGKITVKSEPGIGSQFTVFLSFNKVDKLKIVHEKSEEINTDLLKGLKVLIVDDDNVNRLLGEIVLKNLSCEVDTAINGKNALNKLRNNTYDLVLLDIHMPDISGIEVAKIVRNELKNKKIKLLAFTAAVLKKDIASFKKIGIDNYIKKPFKELELYNKICEIMGIDIDHSNNQEKEIIEIETNNLYDLKDLKEITKGDQRFINKMLLRFIENAEEGIKNIQQKYHVAEFKEVGELAHKLIPSYKHLNINKIEAELRALKNDCFEKQDQKAIKLHIDSIAMNTTKIITELRKEIK